MKKFLISIFAIFLIVGCSNEETKENVEKVEDEVEVVEEVVEIPEVERLYLDVIRTSYETLSESLGIIQEKFAEAEADNSVLVEQEWRNTVRGEFMRLSLSYALLTEMRNNNDVPVGYEELHQAVEDAFKTYSEAGVVIMEVVDNDVVAMSQLKEGSDLMSEANEKVVKSTELFLEEVNKFKN